MPNDTPLKSRLQGLLTAGLLVAALAGGWVMTDEDPVWQLHQAMSTNTLETFSSAKKHLFTSVDRDTVDDSVTCVYSGMTVTLVPDGSKYKLAPHAGVDVEHTWACNAEWITDSAHFSRTSSVPGSDLHHLFPTRAGPNRSRGQHRFGELPAGARQLWVKDNGFLGEPDVDTPSGSFRDENAAGIVVFEPRDGHKGNVARAMFYMSVRYWMEIPEDMEEDLRRWHELDPVDEAELARNDRVEAVQGNRNLFVDDEGLVELIADF